MKSTFSPSKPALLNTLTLLLFALFQLIAFQSRALATPLAESSLSLQSLGKRYYNNDISPKDGDTGPATSDYPTDDEIRAAFIPFQGPFVFFSGLPNPQTNQAPYQFSQTIVGASILRNAFPRSYINRRYKPNPERSAEWYQNFIDRASGIYADMAVKKGDKVYFVGQWDGTVLDCSIWKRVELPTLLAGNIEITLVDYSEFSNQKPYPGTGENDPSSGGGLRLNKRLTGYCFDWPGTGEDANDPDVDPPVGIPYYPGSCGVHLIQYQKNEGNPASNGNDATSDYRFTILVKDANQELVGEVDYYDAPSGQAVNVDGELPLVFIATAGTVDDDPVKFAYGSQNWDSSSAQCKVGGYDSGSRQMDCGFTC